MIKKLHVKFYWSKFMRKFRISQQPGGVINLKFQLVCLFFWYLHTLGLTGLVTSSKIVSMLHSGRRYTYRERFYTSTSSKMFFTTII